MGAATANASNRPRRDATLFLAHVYPYILPPMTKKPQSPGKRGRQPRRTVVMCTRLPGASFAGTKTSVRPREADDVVWTRSKPCCRTRRQSCADQLAQTTSIEIETCIELVGSRVRQIEVVAGHFGPPAAQYDLRSVTPIWRG